MAKRLVEMNGKEAYEHYVCVVDRRFKKAYRINGGMREVTDPMVRRMLQKEFEDLFNKAHRFSQPMEWQKTRALELRDTCGMGVAAGFMRAHGWTADMAHEVLFD